LPVPTVVSQAMLINCVHASMGFAANFALLPPSVRLAQANFFKQFNLIARRANQRI
jgi:hypothetical protein